MGIHIDYLTRFRGNQEAAYDAYYKDLKWLRKVCPVNRISYHGSGILGYKNLELSELIVQQNELGIKDAMLDIDFSDVSYYSDAGKDWSQRRNFFDKPLGLTMNYHPIGHICDLIRLIKSGKPNHIYINSHPELWSKHRAEDLLECFLYGWSRYILKKCLVKLTIKK